MIIMPIRLHPFTQRKCGWVFLSLWGKRSHSAHLYARTRMISWFWISSLSIIPDLQYSMKMNSGHLGFYETVTGKHKYSSICIIIIRMYIENTKCDRVPPGPLPPWPLDWDDLNSRFAYHHSKEGRVKQVCILHKHIIKRSIIRFEPTE